MPHFEELRAIAGDAAPPPLFESTGILSGGALSINGGDNTKFDMAAGLYGFTDYTYDASSPVRTLVPKAAVTAQTVTNIATQLVTYVGVDINGDIIQSSTPFTNAQRRTIAQVGVLVHSNMTNLNAVNDTAAPVEAGISQLFDLMTAIGPMNVSGNVVGANGANLNINKSAGTVFKLGSTFQLTPLNPHLVTLAALVAPANIRYRMSNSTESANTAVLDPLNFESPLGTLVNLSSPNKFSVQRIALFTSNLIRIQYGQAEYNSMAEAEAAIPTQSFTTEANIAENGVIIAYVILRRSTTDLTNTADAKFLTVGKFGNVSSGGQVLTSTDQLPEGSVNLYFTDARARAAVITASITNGDTTHSPSGDAVFDALALKADLAGATFSGPVQINSTLGVTGLSTLASVINTGSLAATKTGATAVTPNWQRHGVGAVTANQNSADGLFRWSADALPPGVLFSKSRGATQGTHTVVANADSLGRVDFLGSDGAAFFEAARIEALCASTPGAGSVPGMLVLSTTAVGGGSATAALTLNIDQSGLFANALTVPTTLVVGNSSAIPANTRALIDRIGTGTLPTLPGGTALTLQGNNAASNNNYLVNIAGASGQAGIRFGDSAAANQGRIDYDNATDGFVFFTNNTLALSLSSAGILTTVGLARMPSAINSSTAALQSFMTTAGATPNWQIAGSAAAESFMGMSRFVAGAGGPALFLGHSRGAAPGTQTVLLAGDGMGLVSFFGSDGTQFREGARISAEVDGTPGTGDMPGRLLFMVSPDGVAAPAEALRLSQNLAASFAGTLSAVGAATLQSTLVVGDNVAIPANTKAFIDRLTASPLPALTAGTVLTLAGSVTAGSTAFLQLISGNAATSGLRFGDTDAANRGAVNYSHTTDSMTLVTAGATAVTIDSTQNVTVAAGLTGTSIYNTYTPTLTAITNVSASSANVSGWIRIGDAVLVFAQISVTATAAAALTVIDISLPVASNFGAATQAVGAGSILTAGTEVAAVAISANATNDRARATFVSTSNAARTYTVVFGYIVI